MRNKLQSSAVLQFILGTKCALYFLSLLYVFDVKDMYNIGKLFIPLFIDFFAFFTVNLLSLSL